MSETEREREAYQEPCQLTIGEIQSWLTTWIRANTPHKKFSPRRANVSHLTWAKAAKGFANWIAFYSVADMKDELRKARERIAELEKEREQLYEALRHEQPYIKRLTQIAAVYRHHDQICEAMRILDVNCGPNGMVITVG